MFKKDDEVNFFNMFIKSADYACIASNELLDLVNNFLNVSIKAEKIFKTEKEADDHFHTIYKELNNSFIPPLERADILDISQALDNVVDFTQDITNLFLMYDIRVLQEDVVKFVELIVKICTALKDALTEFKDFKKSKLLIKKIILINNIEEEGDILYRNSIKRLFSNNSNPIEVFKWHEIYTSMENCIDSCETVSNTIEDVILKNS